MPALRRFLTAAPLLAGALTITFSAPLAAAPHWTPLGPYGGFVDTLTVDPAASQVLYASARFVGTFKSVDGGATWSLIHAGTNGNVAVDPSRHTTIYSAFNFDRVLKSVDGGATWSSASRGLSHATIKAIAVDPAKRDRVYLATDGGVWHSLDGGFSWKHARQGLQGDASHVLALAVARRPTSTIFAATAGGVFKSTDAGDSWKPASQGLPAGWVTTLVIAPGNSQILWASVNSTGIFRSTNGGASWSPVGTQPPDADFAISLAVAPGDPSTAWVGTFFQGAYLTTDAGAHWTPVGPRATTQVAALAATTSKLYASVAPDFRDPGGVLASTDGGGTWQSQNTGLAAIDTPDLAIDPHHPETLWAAARESGLYRSTVGGRLWDFPVQPPEPANRSTVLPPTVDRVAFSADGAVLYTVFNFELWASDDGGASWRLSLGPETTPSASHVSFSSHPVDATAVYAWSSQAAYGSHDSGATWQPLSSTGFACFISDLALAPSAPATLYALGANASPDQFTRCLDPLGAIARSTDGGTSWEKADDGPGGLPISGFPISLAVDPLDPRRLYALASQVLWKSSDGGATWLRVGDMAPGELVFSADGGTLWAASGSQVLASHDGAATWQSQGGPQAFIERLVPDPLNPNRLYAATSGGVWVLEP